MTAHLDLREFLDAYLGETGEHVANANAQLLAIEINLRNGEPIARQVREVFHALHTIKGLSAMVGVDPIVAIAHRMESVLRNADRGGGHLAKGAVDVLLEGTREIEQRVRALHSGATPMAAPGALLDALDALEEDVGQPPARPEPGPRPLALDPAIASKLATFEHEAIARAVAAGRRAICATFAPSTALAAAGITINSVRKTMGEIAEIVKVVPLAVAPSPEAPAGLAFGLVALTAVSNEEVARLTSLGPSAIITIAEPPTPTKAPSSSSSLLAMPPAGDDASELEVRHSGVVRVDVSRLDEALERLSALIISRFQLAREIARLAESGVDTRTLVAIAREQARQLRDLRSSILGLRMVPLSEVLERVPLIVRGLQRTTGKTVALVVDVGRSELDKAVAERIFPAIVHLVRNAVDHGIESAEARLAAGKPAVGSLRIECAAVGNAQLELRISDDGGGIDRADLARRAGTAVPDSDNSALQLLCRAGLSTRDHADATSGRGMGMDIVRRIVVEQLGGELSLRSEPGRGTTFVLRVPLTISIVDAFTFECAEQRFAVPLSMVEEIVDIDVANVAHAPLRASSRSRASGLIERRGTAVSVVPLEAALGLTRPNGSAVARPKGLIVESDGEAIAFVVDRMLGQQEIVVRPLEDPLLEVAGISGATDLGDGRPTLILDLIALSARHLGARTSREHSA